MVCEDDDMDEQPELNLSSMDDDARKQAIKFGMKDWRSVIQATALPNPSHISRESRSGLTIADALIRITHSARTYPHDESFDDYQGGPVLEDIQVEKLPTFSSDCWYSLDGPMGNPHGTTFRDRGYRLLRNFAQICSLEKPKFVMEHISPTSSIVLKDTTVCPKDALSLGVAELLTASTGEHGATILVNGVICDKHGRLKSYVHFNMRKGSTPVLRLRTCADIDSAIWVTDTPQFNTCIHVFEGPQPATEPPIPKSNHITVDLLMPQSQSDQERGPRSEYFVKTFQLSQLPHARFGKIDRFSLIIFFPRMAHQHRISNRNYWSATVLHFEQKIFY
jgi:hypothetical protein